MSTRGANKNRAARRRTHEAGERATDAPQLRQALEWLLSENIFAGLAFHGNTSWLVPHLVALTLLWIWSPNSKLTGGFDDARTQSLKLLGTTALTTYQGLCGALQRWSPVLMPLLQQRVHELIVEIGGSQARVGRWLALAVDGSRVGTPRTQSNEQAFCAKNYGQGQTAKYRKKKTKGMRRRKNEKAKPQPPAPQIWVTLMWHIGLGLPWCWKLGPSNSSERQHVLDMIASGHFVKNTLFVGDAGFVGYDFWKLILERKHDFLVRVGANVRLLQNLGFYTEERKGIVYCWPRAAMKKHLPPLTLRLVACRVGHKPVWLLTSVLNEAALTSGEIAQLYKQRWGVELEFRGLKQTFKRRVLRSRDSARALVEMEWSILGMTLIELFALRQQLRRKSANPAKLSFAQSLDAIREALKHLDHRPDHLPDLNTRLQDALIDDYERKRPKAARYQPQKKDKPSCGQPIVLRATADQRKKSRLLDNLTVT
jgi:hypothetical protein